MSAHQEKLKAKPIASNPWDTNMSENQSKARKQAEAAFSKELGKPIPMPGHQLPANVAEENMARQKAARLARVEVQAPKRKS